MVLIPKPLRLMNKATVEAVNNSAVLYKIEYPPSIMYEAINYILAHIVDLICYRGLVVILIKYKLT